MLRSLATVTICTAALVCQLDPAEASSLRPGFATGTLGQTDDGSSGSISLGFTVDFYGLTYDSLYVNNNGNLTFGASFGAYSPTALHNAGQAIIAPFFADVDTANGIGNAVTYGTGSIEGRDAFAANWIDVNYYNNSTHPDRLNSFQVVLIDRSDTGLGNFDIEFNYERIVWEAGTASGADLMGLGGSAARAGYSAGNGDETQSMEFTGSGVNGAFVDGGLNALSTTSNTGIAGRHLYEMRRTPNVAIVAPTPVPLPSSASLLLAAFGLLAYRQRRLKAH
jgi:hypothetical protein